MILDYKASGEETALLAEFKISLNAYLKELVSSPVRTMADVVAFNNKNPELVSLQAYFLFHLYSCKKLTLDYDHFGGVAMQEMINEIDQDHFLSMEATKGIGKVEKAALSNLARLSKDGFEKLMMNNKLDALVTPKCSSRI